MNTKTTPDREDASKSPSISEAFCSHMICALALSVAWWVANNVYSINLVSDPSHTLRLISVIECPIVILLYSRFRRNPEQCSAIFRIVLEGCRARHTGNSCRDCCILENKRPNNLKNKLWILLRLLQSHFLHSSTPQSINPSRVLILSTGTLLNALGAIALGAPVGTQPTIENGPFIIIRYFSKTLYWSFLMSSFTFVPAASVFGPSWTDWQHIYARTKPVEAIDYMICLPAHGAVIGAWFGAWSMPLDWERPWQEWPICVSYGSIAGYLIAMVVCIIVLLVCSRWQHLKGD